jgi:hypothetical protein
MEIALVQVEPVGKHIGRKENIRQPIIVDVSDGDTAAIVKIAVGEDVELLIVSEVIRKIDLRLGSGIFRKSV